MKAFAGEHWRPQDRDVARLRLEILGTVKVKVRCAGMMWDRILKVPGFSSIALATSARKLSMSSTVSVRTWK
jgi:hypothetical protein